MRTMYDGITPSNLPSGGDLYAGYVDGRWPDAAAIAERFPGKSVVRIATSTGTNDGVVGDGPPDNGTWAEWVKWAVRRRAAGVDPTVYTNASSWSAGIQAFKDAGVAQPHWWIAHYDGDPTIPSGAVAKQYASNASYDTSSVADYWPGVDPAPKPAASAAILAEETMQLEPLSVHPGEYAFIVPPGVAQLVLAADGYEGGSASFRVVLWNNDKPAVLNNVAVGGASGHHVVGHPLAGADAVTVRRLDSEDYPVAAGFR